MEIWQKCKNDKYYFNIVNQLLISTKEEKYRKKTRFSTSLVNTSYYVISMTQSSDEYIFDFAELLWDV